MGRPKLVGVRFEDSAAAYLAYRKPRLQSPRSVENERSTINSVRKALGGRNPWLSTLDEAWWEDFFYGDEGRAHTLEASSFNVELGRIRRYVAYCARRFWIDPRCLEGIDNRKVIRRSRMILTPEQLMQLVEHAAYPSHRIALAVGANTALRGSEIAGIRVGRINLDANQMVVRLWKQKKDAVVSITADLDRELRLWLPHYAEAMGRPLENDWHLVPRQFNITLAQPGVRGFASGAPRRLKYDPDHSPAHPYEIVQLAMDRMGLEYEPGEGFHTTRRAFAAAYFYEQVRRGNANALRETSALLRHSNVQMTERYLQINWETLSVAKTLEGVPFLSELTGRAGVTQLRRVEA